MRILIYQKKAWPFAFVFLNHSAVITTGGNKSSAIRFASHTAGGVKSFSTWTTTKIISAYRIVGYYPNTLPKGLFDVRPDKYNKGSNYLQTTQKTKMYMGSSKGNVNTNYVITVQGFQDYSSGKANFGYCTSINRLYNGNNQFNKSGTPNTGVVKALSYGLSDPKQSYKDVNTKLGITTLKNDAEAFYITQIGIWIGMGVLSFDGTNIKHGSYTVQANSKNSRGSTILVAAKTLTKVIKNSSIPVPPKKPTMKIAAPSPNKATYNTAQKAYIAGPYLVSISAGKMGNYTVSFTQNAVKATIVDSSYKAKTTFKTSEKFYIKVPTASAAATVGVKVQTEMVRQPNITMYTPKVNSSKVQGVITGEANPNPTPYANVTLKTEIASLTLTKKDADTGKAVTTGGAGFQLKMGSTLIKFTGSASAGYTYSPSGTVTTIYTNASTGTVALKGLPLGSYTITETVAPTNYNLPAKPTQTITLKSGANSVSFSYPYKTGNLTLKKTDEETGELVKASAGFTIKQGSTTIKFTGSPTAGYKVSTSGTVTTIKTNPATGTVAITGLKIGSYTITEVSPPEGYDLPATRSQTIKIKTGANSVTFKDPKTINDRLTLIKKDKDTDEIVLGSTGFSIVRKVMPEPEPEPESSEPPTSSEDNTSSNVSSGGTSSDAVGRSTSISARSFFEASSENTSSEKISPNDTSSGAASSGTSSSEAASGSGTSSENSSSGGSSSDASSEDSSSEPEPKPDPEPVKVQMTFSGSPEKGYTYDLDGKITELFTDPTTGRVLITGLEEGDYIITETKAPENYNLPENPSQEIALITGSNTVTFKDPRKTSEVVIHKTDKDTGNHVEGKVGFTFTQDDDLIKFTELSEGRYRVDANGTHTVVYTDPDTGKATILGLRLDDDYLVEEVEAPRGYNLPENTKQIITIKEADNELIFADPAKYGELVIHKVNEDEAPPEGITFRVTGENFDELFTIPEGETSVTVTNLKAGNYTITEEDVPVQYATPTPTEIFIDGDGAQEVAIENKLKCGRFQIVKRDVDNKETLLPGTAFTITGDGEELLERLITDEKGRGHVWRTNLRKIYHHGN